MGRKTGEAKQFLHFEGFINRLICVANNQVPVWRSSLFELLRLIRRPTPLPADPVHLGRVQRVVLVCCLSAVFPKKRMHVHTHLQTILVVTKVLVHLAVIIKQRFEVGRVATNNGKDHRQAKSRGPHHRFRCTANSYPDVELVVDCPGQNFLVKQRGPKLTFPGYPLFFIDFEQKFQFLLEQLIVIREVVTKQWKGFGKTSAADINSARPLEMRSIVAKL